MAKLIGTAGHVDHGKTTLIQALTGIDADRLPEEKRRGMTIDIGFAYIDLPLHGRVSIVDVPGHERFLTNMLVGALGIDVALLCVGADESVMPQTREHFEILELLPVDKLVVAMTRVDLADAEIRALAREEIAELLAPSRFAGAQIVEVSAMTGEGLDELKSRLDEALGGTESVADDNRPWYLPVDRAFTIKGFGAVVTGTLAQGIVREGDTAIVMPEGLETRIRGIRVHDEPRSRAEKGMRTALNLGGLKLEDLRRGQAVGAPGALFESRIVDARIHWCVRPRHGSRVRVSVGAEEAIGKAFLSDFEPEIAQLRLETSVAVARDQPLIVRRYSPPDLLGGGRVVVPVAKVRRKSESIVTVVHGEDETSTIVALVAKSPQGMPTEELCRLLGKTPQAIGDTLERLKAGGELIGFAGLWLTPSCLNACTDTLLSALMRVHERAPTRSTVPREAVLAEARLEWKGKPLDRILTTLGAEGTLRVQGTEVAHPDFVVRLNARQEELLTRVEQALASAGVNVPGEAELAAILGVPPQAVEDIVRVGLSAGRLVRIADGIVYGVPQLEAIKAVVRELAADGKSFTAGDFRDRVQTSRKYAIPLLEYFDSIRLTARVGEARVLHDR